MPSVFSVAELETGDGHVLVKYSNPDVSGVYITVKYCFDTDVKNLYEDIDPSYPNEFSGTNIEDMLFLYTEAINIEIPGGYVSTERTGLVPSVLEITYRAEIENYEVPDFTFCIYK